MGLLEKMVSKKAGVTAAAVALLSQLPMDPNTQGICVSVLVAVYALAQAAVDVAAALNKRGQS